MQYSESDLLSDQKIQVSHACLYTFQAGAVKGLGRRTAIGKNTTTWLSVNLLNGCREARLEFFCPFHFSITGRACHLHVLLFERHC